MRWHYLEQEQHIWRDRFRRATAVVVASFMLAACANGDTAESGTDARSNQETATSLRDEVEGSPENLSHSVVATTYWIGEDASAENDYISNQPSAWDNDAVETFGGIDDPGGRRFTPRHNTFYFALPAAEFDENGLIPGARESSPWADEIAGLADNESLFKGRWIEVIQGRNVIYAQWHDVGPNEEMDYDYVFGRARPSNEFGQRAGLDLSPDAASALGTEGSAPVRWKFVDEVPDGPWTEYPPIPNTTDWN